MSTEGRGPGDPLRGVGQPPEPVAPGVGALPLRLGTGSLGAQLSPWRISSPSPCEHPSEHPSASAPSASAGGPPATESRWLGRGWPHPGLDFSTSL